MEETTSLSHEVVCFQMIELIDTSESQNQILRPRNQIQIFKWKITSFSKTMLLLEEAVSHNSLYYQQLSIARYKISFYAHNYF